MLSSRHSARSSTGSSPRLWAMASSRSCALTRPFSGRASTLRLTNTNAEPSTVPAPFPTWSARQRCATPAQTAEGAPSIATSASERSATSSGVGASSSTTRLQPRSSVTVSGAVECGQGAVEQLLACRPGTAAEGVDEARDGGRVLVERDACALRGERAPENARQVGVGLHQRLERLAHGWVQGPDGVRVLRRFRHQSRAHPGVGDLPVVSVRPGAEPRRHRGRRPRCAARVPDRDHRIEPTRPAVREVQDAPDAPAVGLPDREQREVARGLSGGVGRVVAGERVVHRRAVAPRW